MIEDETALSGHAHAALTASLAGRSEQEWLDAARSLVLRGEITAAAAVLAAALTEHTSSLELQFAFAGALAHRGDTSRAEELLRNLLQADPNFTAASLLLARLLKEQGRIPTMSGVLRERFGTGNGDIDSLMQALEMLDDAGRQHDAAALCETRIAACCADPRLHAYAGMLLAQLGRFERARERRLYALEHHQQAADWHVPLGLADQQRYGGPNHPDFALFYGCLQRPGLSPRARAGLLFALGKAHDDLGEHGQAAKFLREANAIVHSSVDWSRKRWRRAIEARIARRLPPATTDAERGWTPVFIVGVPRSGTTLLAERLASHAGVIHRGELGWMPRLAGQLDVGAADYPCRLAQAAETYAAQLTQEDTEARWFIDKQPLNFLHVDLILAMFPRARIICCTRAPRDNALSLWMQSFQAGAHDYAYDITDIDAFIRGSRRLMTHWQSRFPASVQTVAYEILVAEPATCLKQLSSWLGLVADAGLRSGPTTERERSISTASLWQARQPTHTRSVGRWRHYAPYLPELLRLPER